MTAQDVQIRPARAEDFDSWFVLWRGYCAALGGTVPEDVTVSLWRRLIAADDAIRCLVAAHGQGEPIGFAIYVIHPNTWSLKPDCYLEDLFVAAGSRGQRVGQKLIETLIALGKERDWRRVYWHTREGNRSGRALYDRVVQRTDYIRYDVQL
jgi:GNAT superfamily N-acetyltransferase